MLGMPTGQRPDVRLYADPVCPFAHLALRWLEEAQRHRPLDLEVRLMSLAVLGVGRRCRQVGWSTSARGPGS